MTLQRVAVLGATGSIGVQALAVLAGYPERARPVALAAATSLAALCEQARRLRPVALALEAPADPEQARVELGAASPDARVFVGPGAAARLVAETECDVVVNGIVGAAGLHASLATLARGARLALANKETLVVGGALVRAALALGGELIPVDSEHSAAFQCLRGRPEDVARLTLTASGGALRGHPDWRRATREEVLRHPVWAMGPRITVDSALLFNKGLELIEAQVLFDLPWDRLDAVLHPQALIHAFVTYRDGSMVAQAAPADMKLPIQLALSWPERWGPAVPALSPEQLAGLEIAALPPGRYPAFDLACAAGRAGGTTPCVLNAADEVAVAAFLEGKIALGQVVEVVEEVVTRHRSEPVESLAQLERVDAWARDAARDEAVRA
ncbi:MAG TPA: 1-deoxy-D-xylulose-5-phosphate reductoisomerase [Candidatus Limnocylindria bacterium]|nr:1-deoxy-D-xylulose-5-phosphate reductoisomerase [Candidatus Limnocylindria bacterium]